MKRQEMGGELLAELAVLYPAVTSCSYSESLRYLKGSDTPDTVTVVTFTASGSGLTGDQQQQLGEMA
ncbi:MAG: hypothetical protein MZV63_32430 [Marinilabiliales bacterium]|nr:hypothetical protein [Marinilabiliales bacterium]